MNKHDFNVRCEQNALFFSNSPNHPKCWLRNETPNKINKLNGKWGKRSFTTEGDGLCVCVLGVRQNTPIAMIFCLFMTFFFFFSFVSIFSQNSILFVISNRISAEKRFFSAIFMLSKWYSLFEESQQIHIIFTRNSLIFTRSFETFANWQGPQIDHFVCAEIVIKIGSLITLFNSTEIRSLTFRAHNSLCFRVNQSTWRTNIKATSKHLHKFSFFSVNKRTKNWFCDKNLLLFSVRLCLSLCMRLTKYFRCIAFLVYSSAFVVSI